MGFGGVVGVGGGLGVADSEGCCGGVVGGGRGVVGGGEGGGTKGKGVLEE